jgi:hypothetical protein
MSDKRYPKNEESDVQITFNDGEVKTYRITASPSIGGYLAREAGQSGILCLWNRGACTSLPVENIREWTIVGVVDAAVPA